MTYKILVTIKSNGNDNIINNNDNDIDNNDFKI